MCIVLQLKLSDIIRRQAEGLEFDYSEEPGEEDPEGLNPKHTSNFSQLNKYLKLMIIAVLFIRIFLTFSTILPVRFQCSNRHQKVQMVVVLMTDPCIGYTHDGSLVTSFAQLKIGIFFLLRSLPHQF